MQRPIPLELTEVALRRLLAIRGEAERELVAAPLVLESVDAAEGLRHRHVEDEVGHGEQADGHPAVAALQPRRLRLAEKHHRQEEEEEVEELPQLLLLEVDGPLFLERFLEMELDYGVQSLQRRLFRDHNVVAGGGGDWGLLVLRHWRGGRV
ncbi:hypothetical protein C2S52_007824 [Perilla frutescens var. hirtella]|uniref:Uncharacterized protein n=1 Tax=Perilla frutescens var. hirtella TaxID=608512 RepID=A0AAD4P3L1_PERFH|nr:hypothetical protein C2S52_007824 [Perilla frutescens var. hirtella]KAH6812675.1 hypothetical protein C2S51_021693 [Perilla frutescens var. frutescens]KAH6825489.1 hypothetical protein C2S53_005976 [Perilla frutescens var. hirtella]